ncbi:MAG: hypothetical protein K0S44_1292 [Bacteroidetes bacterium]|jgi:hypothetical protein|nr:hypothetical protein [Bacteroidota bacterium]
MKTIQLLKSLLIVVTFGVMNTFLYAQVNAYSFSSSSGTYAPITGTALFGTAWDDSQTGAAAALNLGFNFNFSGTVYTQVRVSSNGFLVFANNPNATNYSPISTTQAYDGCVSAFGRDIINNGQALTYTTLGSAPNRIFVVQWNNARRYNLGAVTGDVLNFQIRLNETTDIIEVVYGSCTITSTTALTCQVGLRGISNADFNNRTTTTDWANTQAGLTNNATMASSNSVLPSSGLTYAWSPPSGCAGTPVAGTTNSSVNPVCNGSPFLLSVSGATVASGLTYQWQSSSDGISYSNITSATNSTYTATQTVPTYYQVVITCTNSSQTATSAPLNVTMNSPMNCYCTSSANNTADEEIYSVTVNGATNAYSCTTVAPGPGSVLSRYSNFTTLPSLTTITQGSVVPFSIQQNECDGATYYANGASIWIDFNQNGLFTDAGEQVFVETATATGPRTISGNFNVPIGAVLGSTRMRIIVAEALSGTGLVPCGTYGYGETEDYLINIIAATNCAGTPTPGATQSTASSVCSASNFTLSMSTPPTGLSGITYQWQSSSDGSTYNNISGATSLAFTTTQTSATYYQVVVTCTNSASSATSTPIQVTMNPFYNCYCAAVNSGTACLTNVTINTLNNTTAGCAAGNYSQQSATTSVFLGTTVNLALTTNATAITSVWFDWNQNGIFEPAEWVQPFTTGTTGTIAVTIPLSALAGTTGMRVRSRSSGNTNGANDACTNMGSGETEDYMITILPLPPNPPTPVQDPAPPTCSAGTNLSVPGSPAAGDAWYWQTTTNSTSITNPVSGPYTVFLNGTYYVRTFNATNNVWSLGSDSVTVSNIPIAALPPSPIATASPACLNTTISMVPPPAGTGYFWQGTNNTGASSSQNASSTFTVSSSGTYYVAAYDSITSCWSNTNGVNVVINTYVPAAPTSSNDSLLICQGAASALINAAAAGSDSVIVSFGLSLQSPGTPVTFNVTVPSIPAGATISNTQLQVFGATAVNGSYRSEIRVELSGATTLGATQLSNQASGGLITPNPVITVPNLPLSGGAVTLTLTETFDDGGLVTDATFTEIRLIIRYTLPASTISWWNASASGTQLGTGSPFQTIGTTMLPNSNTPGTYVFYAEANSGTCSSTRTPVSVIINPLPIATLTDTAVCATPYLIDAQNSGSTYLWNTSETTQTINATAAGMHYVTITTASGCSANDSMNLVVNSPPIVNLGADVAFCTGDSILLDAANTGFTFLWNDLTTNQTLTTDVSGNFYVTVTNPMTLCAASDSIMVAVNPLPLIDLGMDTSICVGDSLILDAGNPGASYAWSNAASGQTITVNSPASYFVFVTDPVTTCYSSDTIVITQNILPVVSVGADTAICNGDVLTLDAGYPGSSYTWNDLSSGQTLSITTAGNYSVMVVDSNGCKDTDSINVSINAVPVVDLGPDTTQCAGTVQLDAGNAGSVFMWNNLSASQTISAAATGTYYVAVTNSNACTTVDSIVVTINPLPVISLGNDTTICGGSLVLDAGNTGFMHLWYNNTTAQTLTVYSTNTVSVVVTNPLTGCVNMDTISVTFNQYPLVNLGSDTAQCAGSITLDPGSNPGAVYAWSTSATTQTINVTSTGTYIVTVNNNGCIKSDTVVVTINAVPFVGFPAIAPICLQGGAINLIGNPSGGIFIGGSSVSAGMFNPVIAGLGSHPVLYTITDVNGCSNSTSQIINVADCTGIDELEELSNVNVYPNPTSGMFTISLVNANFGQLNIIITDIQGKEVFNFSDKNIVGDYTKEVSLEGLAKGIYYIRLNSSEDIKIKKLIVN